MDFRSPPGGGPTCHSTDEPPRLQHNSNEDTDYSLAGQRTEDSLNTTSLSCRGFRARQWRRKRRRTSNHPAWRPPATLGLSRTMVCIFLFCCYFSTLVTATTWNNHPFQGTLERLDRAGHLLVDTRPPPGPADNAIDEYEEAAWLDSIRWDDDETADESPSPSSDLPTRVVKRQDTASQSADPTGSIMVDPNAASASGLPKPFDTGVGTNYSTKACPDYLSSILSNSTFKACLPFSLLLQNSDSFFQAEKSIVRITQVLDATCGADFDKCSAAMGDFANGLASNDNCGNELQNQNPLVVQAHTGLIAYQPMYQAGCTRSETGSYCFADAITNTSSPTDAYVYYAGLGISLPGGSTPTCNKCLQDVMSAYAKYASNSSQPISSEYTQTASLLDMNCGPSFINQTIPKPANGASSLSPASSLKVYLGISALTTAWFIWL